MSERAVELGWVMAQNPRGTKRDAGSTLNRPFALDALLPEAETLTIATLYPEPRSYPEPGARYVNEDLRALPFPDRAFDTVISISVLEHVGLDTSLYGAEAHPAPDPQAEAKRAMRELARVVRPGGKILFSVPFGHAESSCVGSGSRFVGRPRPDFRGASLCTLVAGISRHGPRLAGGGC